MRGQALKKLGLGLGTLGVIGTLWLLLAPDTSGAIRLRTGLPNCSGEAGRFQIVAHPPRHVFLLDTCSGEVWGLVQSPDKMEPGAWVIMDHYDTREEGVRLIDYLRGAGQDQAVAQPQPPAHPPDQADQGQPPSTDQQAPVVEESPAATEQQNAAPDSSRAPSDQPTHRRR